MFYALTRGRDNATSAADQSVSTQVIGPDLKGRMLIKAYVVHALGPDPVVDFTGPYMECFQIQPSMMREGKDVVVSIGLSERMRQTWYVI